MAKVNIRVCEVCGERFRQEGAGRPAKTCPIHRGASLSKRQTIATETKAVDSLDTDTKVTDTDIHNLRPNKFDGRCFECRQDLPAGVGVLFKVDSGPSKAFHDACLRQWQEARRQAGDWTPPKTAQDAATDAQTLIAKGNTSEAMEALKALAESLAPKIDEDAIRAIVNDAIGDGLSEDRIKSLVRAAGVQRHEIVVNGELRDMPAVHHSMLPAIVKRLGAGVPGKRLNLFLPGPAGSGKSTVVEQAAEMLGLGFASMSLGPTTPTSKFFGFNDANGRFNETDFYRAYTQGWVFLIDEMDNGHPGLLAELNQALANSTAAFANGMAPKHPDFRCCATGNTFGKGPDRLFVGRNILDAATLDRFVVKEFPIDETMETRAAMAFANDENESVIARYVALVQDVRKRVSDARLQIVVSPRASIDGALMLSADIPVDEVIEERLIPGMAADTRTQLETTIANLKAYMERTNA